MKLPSVPLRNLLVRDVNEPGKLSPVPSDARLPGAEFLSTRPGRADDEEVGALLDIGDFDDAESEYTWEVHAPVRED